MKKKIFLSIAILTSSYAQDLKTTINEIINTNPIVLERLKNYNATREDITTAKAGFYPQLNLKLGMGTERTDKSNQAHGAADTHSSYNVYQNSLTYTQNLFNGFSTSYQLKGQEYKTLSAAYSYIEKVNDRAFATANQYIEVMKNEALLENAQENIDINQQIFERVQKLYDSGLTTLSEVNKIESSLALAKSNYVVQENTLLNQNFKLATLLGRSLDVKKMTRPSLSVKLPSSREAAAEFAIAHNPSIWVSKYNIKLAQATKKEKSSLYYPKIDISVSQSMNKNLSAIEGNTDAFKAMVFLSYNLFNGFSDEAQIQKSISSIHQEVASKNNIQRQIIEGLNLSYIAHEKLQEQLVHLMNYKKYSQKTLKLYKKEYDLGRRSLLDLLSAQNDFIRSKAQIITTNYSILYAKYRILDAMGILVDTVLGENNEAYLHVGLHGTPTPLVKDTLPLNYDIDKDLIPVSVDLCPNSLQQTMKNDYGCLTKDTTLIQIERYVHFRFKNGKFMSQKKFKNLLLQLKPYRLKKIDFTLIGKKQRMQILKNLLINAGIESKNIFFVENPDNSNHNVNIIVKKHK